MEAVARPSRALKCMLPVKTTARMVTLTHRDERAVSMAELSAWSDKVLAGADDRGCVTPDAGPATPQTRPGEA